jgi:integrase
VLAMLREHRLASLHSGDSDYVFATATGRPINARNLVTRGLDKAMERAKLDGEGRAKLTWHGLRHIAASMQIAAGYPPEYVARQLGHANSAITQRLYSHEFDRRRDGERRREEYRARYGGILRGTMTHSPLGGQ